MNDRILAKVSRKWEIISIRIQKEFSKENVGGIRFKVDRIRRVWVQFIVATFFVLVCYSVWLILNFFSSFAHYYQMCAFFIVVFFCSSVYGFIGTGGSWSIYTIYIYDMCWMWQCGGEFLLLFYCLSFFLSFFFFCLLMLLFLFHFV